MALETWETASDAEWEEVQRGILKMFGAGPALMQRIIGKVLEVEPPVDRIRRVEQKLQPKVQEPPVVEETPYQKRRRLGQVPNVPTIVSPGLPPAEMAIHRQYQAAGEPGLGAALFEPLVPKPALEQIGKIPLAGPILESTVAGLTSPVGLAGLAAWPATTARMFGYGAALGIAGKGAELAGAPQAQLGPVTLGPSGLGQIAGTVLGPTLGPMAERAAMRGAATLPGVAERVTPFTRRLLAEEAGGPKPRMPEEPIPPEVPPTEPPVAPPTEPPVVPPPDPVDKLRQALEEAKATRPEYEALKHGERVRRAAAMRGIYEAEPGRAGVPKALGTLRGKLPTAKYEPPEMALAPEDIETLFVRAHEATKEMPYTETRAKLALEKVLMGQELPTEGEIALLQSIYGTELGQSLMDLKKGGFNLWREVLDAANIPRSTMTCFDVSASLRQGAPLAVRHPAEFWAAFKDQVKALFSEKTAVSIQEELTTGPKATRAMGAGLDLTDWRAGVPLNMREEGLMNSYVGKMPIIRGSARAYVIFLNKLRRGVFDTQADIWEGLGIATEPDLANLAKTINYSTGRGTLGPARGMGAPLATAFFSPRLVLGRIQYPLTIFSSTPAVRMMVAQELLAFLGTGTAILTAAKLSGAADVETNCLSSDFGKMRIGKLRIDLWGGYQPLARYACQMITGKRKTLGTGEIYGADRKEVFGRFLDSKLSPQAGLIKDVWRGETYLGEKMTADPATIKAQIWNRLTPMFLQDLTEAIRMQKAKGAFALVGALGIGVQTFYTPGEKVDDLAKQYSGGRGWLDISSSERLELMRDHPDLAAARQEQLEASAKWGSETAKAQVLLQQEDAAFGADLAQHLANPEGRTYREISDEVENYFHERAIKNEVRFGQLKIDPRTPTDKRIDDYYSVELPPFASPEDREAYFTRQETLLDRDPELKEALRDLQVLRFTDPAAQDFVARRWDAAQVRKEYYNIPAFTRLSVEEGQKVSRILAEASDMVSLGKAASQKAALRTIYKQGRLTTKEYGIAMNAGRRGVRNRQRAIFWKEHADDLQMFSDVPLE